MARNETDETFARINARRAIGVVWKMRKVRASDASERDFLRDSRATADDVRGETIWTDDAVRMGCGLDEAYKEAGGRARERDVDDFARDPA